MSFYTGLQVKKRTELLVSTTQSEMNKNQEDLFGYLQTNF